MGTAGYRYIEGWPWIDALYMTIITLTTVGFGEVRPLSQTGRMFTILILLFGIGGVAYTTQFLIEYLFTSSLSDFTKSRRMERTLKQLSDHFVICGHGRVGRTAETIAQSSDRPIVIIDADPATGEALRSQDKLCITGDATEDDILLQAGLARARGTDCLHRQRHQQPVHRPLCPHPQPQPLHRLALFPQCQ
ncbi:MAG: NAD-binding protein [Anaerolineales bacterium]|nr:NAD-binding protein [Anaerolineales bacterium]